MGSVREAPTEFVRELKHRFGSDWDVRFNTEIGRWEFISNSAAGKPCSQFLGWHKNPLTGQAIAPDPVTGLFPFRELDATAQAEILRNLEVTFIGNRYDGAGDWKNQIRETVKYNKDVAQKRRRSAAEDVAYSMQQVDLRRPWVKHHSAAGKRLLLS